MRPEIIGKTEPKIALFRPNHKFSDNQKHPNGIRSVKYMKSIDKILCLDQVSEQYYVYQSNGKLWKKIQTSTISHQQDSRILSINWSEGEQRVGACIQDKSLSFWDWSDNLSYEHSFKHSAEYTFINIWYIEYAKIWLTLDSTNILHKWDIYQETSKKFPKAHEQIITDLIEIPTLPAVVASSLDKKIVVWSMKETRPICILNIGSVSAHTLVYSNTFEVMFSAGFESEICVWNFAKSLDITLSRRLPGHNAQITALQIMEPQHILLSADEIGYIKSWDVLTLMCIQSFYFESRVSLSKALTISDTKFIVVGNRFYFFEFEAKEAKTPALPKKTILKPKSSQNTDVNTMIVDLTYFNKKNSICATTTKDIRILDAKNGKCIKVYGGIVREDEEILKCELSEETGKFLVADTAGNLNWVQISDGMIEKTKNNGNLIIDLHYDTKEGISVTTRKNGIIVENDQSQIRDLIGKNIDIESSVISEFLNIMAVFSRDGTVFIYDYCLFKLYGALDCRVFDCIAAKFLEPFKLLVTQHANGVFVIWDLNSGKGGISSFYKAAFSFTIKAVSIFTILPQNLILDDSFIPTCDFLYGTEDGKINWLKFNSDFFSNKFNPNLDKRKESNYNATRVLSSAFPLGEISPENPLKEFKISEIQKLDIEKSRYMELQAHNEAVNFIKLIKIQNESIIVTKGDSQTIKLWQIIHKKLELKGAINIEGAVPFVWKINPQTEITKVESLLKAATCLYEMDKRNGTNHFEYLTKGEGISTIFTTEVHENFEDEKRNGIILYKEIVKNTNNKEKFHDVMSFRQLDIRRSKIEDEKSNRLPDSTASNLKRDSMIKGNKKVFGAKDSLGLSSVIGENINKDDSQFPKELQRQLSPPTLNSDITKFKPEGFVNATVCTSPDDKSLSNMLLLPVIKSMSSLKRETPILKKGVRKVKKDWIEYAEEKSGKILLPLITGEENKRLNRKQLLAQLMEKKKKSMVSRYRPIDNSGLSTSRIPADSKELVKELNNILKTDQTS